MKNRTGTENTSFGFIFTFFILTVFIFPGYIAASNLSDATQLREKCEKEITVLAVPVQNFGDAADLESYAKAEKTVKLGKVMFIQTKYPEAIEQYKQYQKIQYELYRSLAKKYIDRTSKIVDAVAVELVDHVDDKKVEKYMQMANQNLRDAKSTLSSPHAKNAIDLCRTAKNYAFGAYKLAAKTVPAGYEKDSADNDNKVYGK